jgi:hypothetical protein
MRSKIRFTCKVIVDKNKDKKEIKNSITVLIIFIMSTVMELKRGYRLVKFLPTLALNWPKSVKIV